MQQLELYTPARLSCQGRHDRSRQFKVSWSTTVVPCLQQQLAQTADKSSILEPSTESSTTPVGLTSDCYHCKVANQNQPVGRWLLELSPHQPQSWQRGLSCCDSSFVVAVGCGVRLCSSFLPVPPLQTPASQLQPAAQPIQGQNNLCAEGTDIAAPCSIWLRDPHTKRGNISETHCTASNYNCMPTKYTRGLDRRNPLIWRNIHRSRWM